MLEAEYFDDKNLSTKLPVFHNMIESSMMSSVSSQLS